MATDRRSVYSNFSVNVREKSANSVRSGLDKNFQNTIKKLMDLVQNVPNWETYLTDKQAEAVKLYMANRDLNICDQKLGLTKGGTYTRIFGDRFNQHYGAIGRLQKVYMGLESNGHFEDNNNLKQE